VNNILRYSFHRYDQRWKNPENFSPRERQWKKVCLKCENKFFTSSGYRIRCYSCHLESLKETGFGEHYGACPRIRSVHSSECSCLKYKQNENIL
jgi:hypothetical protein